MAPRAAALCWSAIAILCSVERALAFSGARLRAAPRAHRRALRGSPDEDWERTQEELLSQLQREREGLANRRREVAEESSALRREVLRIRDAESRSNRQTPGFGSATPGVTKVDFGISAMGELDFGRLFTGAGNMTSWLMEPDAPAEAPWNADGSAEPLSARKASDVGAVRLDSSEDAGAELEKALDSMGGGDRNREFLSALVEGAPKLDTWLAPRLSAEVLVPAGFAVSKIIEVEGRCFVFEGSFSNGGTPEECAQGIFERHEKSRFSPKEGASDASSLRLLLVEDPDITGGDMVDVDPMQILFSERSFAFVAVSASHVPGGRGKAAGEGDGPFGLNGIADVVCNPLTAGLSLAYFVNSCFGEASQRGLAELQAGPVSAFLAACVGLVLPQVAHELGHKFVGGDMRSAGKRRWVPSPLASGFFGSVQSLQGFPRDRKTLFDFSAAGPLCGMAAATALLVVGAVQTYYTSPADAAAFPALAADLVDRSPLGALLLTAPRDANMLDVAKASVEAAAKAPPVAMAPLALAGYAGLISQGMQALPVRGTDGYRALSAAFGAQSARFAEFVVQVLVTLTNLFLDKNNDTLWFLVAMSFFAQRQDVPCENDVTEVDETRKNVALLLLGAALITVNPIG